MPVIQFIAVVDDDKPVREAIKEYLVAVGLDAEAYPGAEEFLRSGRINDTACLITDVTMPGMSGLQLTEHLSAFGHGVPVIIVTAYVDERSRAEAMRAGAICFLPKPVAMNQLLSCIQSALGLHKPKTE